MIGGAKYAEIGGAVFDVLRSAAHTIGTLEVPDEIALVYTLSGCPLRCPGCHSEDLRNADRGRLLGVDILAEELARYRGLATCVCFLGGEWRPDALISLLREARRQGYATCLYTGRNAVEDRIAVELDYVKLGPWVAARGGLDRPGTNQRFLDLRRGVDLTHRFQRTTAGFASISQAA
ncbi:anaerobic ribonucleoside-triphosphate reductase activating protein [Haloferula luteola]|uniref:Anaerobic ribonucleoside-triphosphate reductase activating protein n=1 Tax=Haloferula luteola TaxID=595692 RepID=A0A840UZP0_9BACT|nr:anaerobic ribonucleoside-triphosphate reductase activating protein [Haloferula luteola]